METNAFHWKWPPEIQSVCSSHFSNCIKIMIIECSRYHTMQCEQHSHVILASCLYWYTEIVLRRRRREDDLFSNAFCTEWHQFRSGRSMLLRSAFWAIRFYISLFKAAARYTFRWSSKFTLSRSATHLLLPSICVVVNVGSQSLRGPLKLMSIPFQWIKCIQAYFSLSLVNQLQNMCKYENWVVEGHFSILFHNKMLTCKWNTWLWTFYIYVMARWIWI